MRLFLASYRAGNYIDELLALMGEETDIAVIHNAKDASTTSERANSVNDFKDFLKEHELKPHEIDLRRYFDDPERLTADLQKFKVVWVAGGNTFVLRRAMLQSGVDELLRELVGNDTLLYIGESAGAIMATPGLQGAEFEDDPYVTPEGYEDVDDDADLWQGLGLIEYWLVPHYESGLEGVERMVDVLEDEGLPYKTLANSQALLIDGAHQEFLA